MPIQKKWSDFTKYRVSQEDDYYGVYELANSNGDILYIGEGRVRSRLLSHFPQGSDPTPGVSYYRVEYTRSKDRCVSRQNALLAEYKRRHGKLPKYNQKSRS